MWSCEVVDVNKMTKLKEKVPSNMDLYISSNSKWEALMYYNDSEKIKLIIKISESKLEIKDCNSNNIYENYTEILNQVDFKKKLSILLNKVYKDNNLIRNKNIPVPASKLFELFKRKNKNRKTLNIDTRTNLNTLLTNENQDEDYISKRHERMNHSFEINELSNRVLAEEMIMTTLYPYSEELDHFNLYWRTSQLNRISSTLTKEIVSRVPQTWIVFLKPYNFKTINELKKYIYNIREQNPSAIISIDFEWGYIKAPCQAPDYLDTFLFTKFTYC